MMLTSGKFAFVKSCRQKDIGAEGTCSSKNCHDMNFLETATNNLAYVVDEETNNCKKGRAFNSTANVMNPSKGSVHIKQEVASMFQGKPSAAYILQR